MKKLSLLLFLVLLTGATTTFAQCTIGPHSQAGFYPLSADGIHPGAAGGPYSLNITIVVPQDTTISGFPSVSIDSIKVIEFIGFPQGFQYYYNTPSGWLKGGNKGCMLIYGTPLNGDIGMHNISFVYTAMIMGFAFTDTINDYWVFEVKDDTHISIPQAGDDATTDFRLFPNPAHETVQFIAPESGNTTVTILDMAGRQVSRTFVQTKAGAPAILPVDEIKPGFYLVLIEVPSGVVSTSKLLINK
jgi:hypothetical protein